MGVGGAGRLKLGIGVGGAGRLKLCTPMLNAAVRTNIRATVFINSFPPICLSEVLRITAIKITGSSQKYRADFRTRAELPFRGSERTQPNEES